MIVDEGYLITSAHSAYTLVSFKFTEEDRQNMPKYAYQVDVEAQETPKTPQRFIKTTQGASTYDETAAQHRSSLQSYRFLKGTRASAQWNLQENSTSRSFGALPKTEDIFQKRKCFEDQGAWRPALVSVISQRNFLETILLQAEETDGQKSLAPMGIL